MRLIPSFFVLRRLLTFRRIIDRVSVSLKALGFMTHQKMMIRMVVVVIRMVIMT